MKLEPVSTEVLLVVSETIDARPMHGARVHYVRVLNIRGVARIEYAASTSGPWSSFIDGPDKDRLRAAVQEVVSTWKLPKVKDHYPK